jgi:hypothetical protein
MYDSLGRRNNSPLMARRSSDAAQAGLKQDWRNWAALKLLGRTVSRREGCCTGGAESGLDVAKGKSAWLGDLGKLEVARAASFGAQGGAVGRLSGSTTTLSTP